MTDEREQEIRMLAAGFRTTGKYPRLRLVIEELLEELDASRARIGESEDRYDELLAACGGVWPS